MENLNNHTTQQDNSDIMSLFSCILPLDIIRCSSGFLGVVGITIFLILLGYLGISFMPTISSMALLKLNKSENSTKIWVGY